MRRDLFFLQRDRWGFDFAAPRWRTASKSTTPAATDTFNARTGPVVESKPENRSAPGPVRAALSFTAQHHANRDFEIQLRCGAFRRARRVPPASSLPLSFLPLLAIDS